MSADFASRIIGMVIFAFLGARLGVDMASSVALPELATSTIFALVGLLFGLVLTPWITVRPVRLLSRTINELPMEVLFTGVLGLLIGLVLSLLLAYPLSLLGPPLGNLLPPLVAVLFGYLGMTMLSLRSREAWRFLNEWLGIGRNPAFIGSGADRQLLLDTSVLIDGRIVDIAKTGFLGGTIIVPRFVISELHRVADSSDPQRRNRGRRGLEKLKELQSTPSIPFKIIEEEIDEQDEVDDKLIALAQKMNAPILTIDYPLNRVASAQGVMVLNINQLANAVRSAYIPGETFPIHIIQEGREPNQGVGYLEDGTMVIVENGKAYMDRTTYVTVTKLINKDTGRIIFAQPENMRS
ncbi:MAG: PIN domain nuclease [Chloroflexota bacterium]|nr:MAG: PIN domain nuclease [Chloroflexota bacterium]